MSEAVVHGGRVPASPHAASGAAPIEVTSGPGESYIVSVRGHRTLVDQPPWAGGQNLGPSPVEVFVAGLAACVAHWAGWFMRKHHLSHEGLRVVAWFDMADELPMRVGTIGVQVIPPVDLSRARREELRMVLDHCTVLCSLREPPHVKIHVT